MSEVLTVEQAAGYLKVTPYTVREWLRQGKIPGRKIGRVYRILKSDLEAFMRGDKGPNESEVDQRSWNSLSRQGREQRISAALGLFADKGHRLESFLEEKHAEIEEEEQCLDKLQKARGKNPRKGRAA